MSACEALPSGLPLSLEQQSATDRHWRGRLQESTKGTTLLSGVNDESLEDFWKVTVEDYTKLDLTNQTDKRMAIWGVVKRIRDTMEEDYVAGMWRDSLEEQLAWRVADCTTAIRPFDLTINPTWSWTSVQGAVLIAARSKKQRRSYIIKSTSGDRITFKLENDSIRPGSTRKHSNNAREMGRELDLVDERRRKSSATSRHHSLTSLAKVRGVGTRITQSGPTSSPRAMSPTRTESQLSSKDLEHSVPSNQNLQSDIEDRWDKEPQLLDCKIAMEGYLNTGCLKRGRSSGRWLLRIDAAHDGTTDIEAFPDILPHTESVEVVFVILALTESTEKMDDAASDHETWYYGHGLMLERTTDTSCYKRNGTLDFRHLSNKIWQSLKRMSGKAEELQGSTTSILGSKFFLI